MVPDMQCMHAGMCNGLQTAHIQLKLQMQQQVALTACSAWASDLVNVCAASSAAVAPAPAQANFVSGSRLTQLLGSWLVMALTSDPKLLTASGRRDRYQRCASRDMYPRNLTAQHTPCE